MTDRVASQPQGRQGGISFSKLPGPWIMDVLQEKVRDRTWGLANILVYLIFKKLFGSYASHFGDLVGQVFQWLLSGSPGSPNLI